MDKHDNVYITDPQSDPECSMQPRVLKFDSEGNFIKNLGHMVINQVSLKIQSI